MLYRGDQSSCQSAVDKNWLIAMLGSAGVGALVSATVTEFGKWRERKSRREELALAKAADMAHEKVKIMMQLFKDTDSEGQIAPDALLLEDYYIALTHLLDRGKLDPGMRGRLTKEMAKHGIDIDSRAR